jgi:hypothetical protein
MPWNCPFTSLDAEQRAVLDKLLAATSPQWVRGFAGSGKSVILIHALGQLRAINPNATACVITFTHSLKAMLESGMPENAKDVQVVTYPTFTKAPFRCDYIFVDEVQDLDANTLNTIRQYAGVVLVAGDEEQSIYENRVNPGEIIRLINPQVHFLNVVYRLTDKLKRIVSHILPGSKVYTARNGRLQTNVTITVAHADNLQLETDWVWKEAKRFARTGDPVAILIPRHHLIQQFIESVCHVNGIAPPPIPYNQWGKPNYGAVNDYFARHGLELRYLGSGYGNLQESEERRIVYLMTYHSAKGLDFETVFLPRLDNIVEINKDDSLARRLFYVAATRSRRTLSISYSSSSPHPLVQALPSDLIEQLHVTNRPPQDDASESIDDIF